MKNTIVQWISKIESASLDELEKIKLEWGKEGENYNPNDWRIFWDSYINRKLVLSGHNITDPPF